MAWTAESSVFSLASFPLYAADWAQRTAQDLQDGYAPWIPGSPFQVPYSAGRGTRDEAGRRRKEDEGEEEAQEAGEETPPRPANVGMTGL
jgi:hypothetical protein